MKHHLKPIFTLTMGILLTAGGAEIYIDDELLEMGSGNEGPQEGQHTTIVTGKDIRTQD